MLSLVFGDFRLDLAPRTGGAIVGLTWQGEDLLRRGDAGDILDVGQFPMLPFCNRIANGAFRFAGDTIALPTNMPADSFPLPLHGYGWVGAWTVWEQGSDHVTLDYDGSGDAWPWDYAARQTFRIAPGRVMMTLAVTNRAGTAMPAGLGFHPYFPCNDRTIYHGLHRERWTTNAQGLPDRHTVSGEAIDWWRALPVQTQPVDDIFAGRAGPLTVVWPDRSLGVRLCPDDTLGFTTVFAPAGADFLCVEPATLMTDAFNRGATAPLAPGATREVHLTLEPFRTAGA